MDRTDVKPAEKTTLIVRHLPADIVQSEESARLHFQTYRATDVRLMQSRSMRGTAFVDFTDPDAAKNAMTAMSRQQMHVEYAISRHSKKPNLETDTASSVAEKDNSTPIAPALGLQYPANPHLRYRYPDPTPETLTNIMHAIASVPRLYIQVLHLMNKMNLRPPFRVDSHAVPSVAKKRKRAELLASDESEPESDDDEEEDHRRAKTISSNKAVVAATSAAEPSAPTANQDTSTREDALTLGEIRSHCLDAQALATLPALKNYKRGDTSRRLYIKNLAKQVQDDDLDRVFSMFQPSMVDLKKTGRLRGQAFITFEDTSSALAALEAAHGYVLYDKPMIIQFSHFIG